MGADRAGFSSRRRPGGCRAGVPARTAESETNLDSSRGSCLQRTVLLARFTVTWSYCVFFFGLVVEFTSTWNIVAVIVVVLP